MTETQTTPIEASDRPQAALSTSAAAPDPLPGARRGKLYTRMSFRQPRLYETPLEYVEREMLISWRVLNRTHGLFSGKYRLPERERILALGRVRRMLKDGAA